MYNQSTSGFQGGPNIIQRNTIPVPNVNTIAQPRKPAPVRTVYIDRRTKNKSFIKISNYLKAIGIKNNSFMLALIDPDLQGVDPFDPHLNAYYKQKVLREVMCNYWYFLREIVRIPDAGGIAVPFRLDRANLATSFCQTYNFNIFE